MNSASFANPENLHLNFKKLLKISHVICMFLVYFEVKFCWDMHVGAGYRSGFSLSTLPVLTPKSLKQEEPGLGLKQTSNTAILCLQQPDVLNMCSSPFLNSEILCSTVHLTERDDYAACFILDSFFININLF